MDEVAVVVTKATIDVASGRYVRSPAFSGKFSTGMMFPSSGSSSSFNLIIGWGFPKTLLWFIVSLSVIENNSKTRVEAVFSFFL